MGAGKEKTEIMAERRMFSKRVISSARFIKMPLTTQALYFHLGLNADDDGIVEAYSVIKSIGCNEDDLKILVTKGFVTVLNEDLVSYILDWQENNKIRPDRKIDSIYQGLLLSLNPDVELVKKRQRADIKVKSENMDNQWTTNGQPMDSIGEDRIGEDRIVKDRVEDNARAREEEPADKTPYKKIMELYHEICISYPKIRDINGERKKAVSARWKANPSFDTFRTLFEKAEKSKFLQGANDRNWKADFDFMMHSSRFDKILEGVYDDKEPKPPTVSEPSYNINEISQATAQKYRDYFAGKGNK